MKWPSDVTNDVCKSGKCNEGETIEQPMARPGALI